MEFYSDLPNIANEIQVRVVFPKHCLVLHPGAGALKGNCTLNHMVANSMVPPTLRGLVLGGFLVAGLAVTPAQATCSRGSATSWQPSLVIGCPDLSFAFDLLTMSSGGARFWICHGF